MAVTWKFVLSELDGTTVGEVVDADERQVTRCLNSASTAGMKINVNHPRVNDVLTKDLLLRAYRNNSLIFHGPMTSVELAADDPTQQPTIACGFTDPFIRLGNGNSGRVAGKSATGTLFTNIDRLEIAETLINTANTEVIDGATRNTGIATLGQHCGSNATWIAGPYRLLSECVQEMAQTLDGFDWRIDPVEYQTGTIGNFKAAASLGGNSTGTAVFEYQGRGNMRVPHYQRDWSAIANKAYHVPPEGAASNLGVRSNPTTMTASETEHGIWETVVDADLSNSTLRDNLLQDVVNIRQDPRRVLSFSPDFDDETGRVPAYGADYTIGDTVRARVLWNGVALIDGSVRLYKMQFDIDANNRETLTPTVVDET